METRYDFAPFLADLRTNPVDDDRVLSAWLGATGAGGALGEVRAYGADVVGPLWEIADEVDRPDRLPVIAEWDAHRRRASTPVRLAPGIPALWDASFGRGLAAPAGDRAADAARLARVFLLAQLGEVGTVCPLACTEGLVRVVERHGGDAPGIAARRIRANQPGRIVHGAQFVTEIHAGSDAGRVTLDATPAGPGRVTLDGAKWFCSNVTADYWVVLARVAGTESEAQLVLVDRAEAEAEAAVSVDRLKDKLGTRALATAEVTLRGAPGFTVGDPGRGLAIVVGVVLTTSRVWTALSSSAFATMAARAARAYARFRTAFGRSIGELPLVRAEVERVTREAEEVEAGTLATTARWLTAGAADDEDRLVRLLVGLTKRRVTTRATRIVHDAMMVLGGNGIEERFSPLPRLLRDAVINETWEGPHNLLCAQAHKDLSGWHKKGLAAPTLDALLAGAPEATALRDRTLALLAEPAGPTFADACDALFDAHARTARAR